jgi:hypothetical protein
MIFILSESFISHTLKNVTKRIDLILILLKSSEYKSNINALFKNLKLKE